jgi:hypothetical protein
MTQSRTLRFVVAIGIAACTLAALPLAGSAHTSPTMDRAGERIATAFEAVQPGIAMGVAQKSDGLARNCAAQRWPDIHVECLAGANGSRPARVRAVSASLQEGRSATVLLRLPSVAALP